MLIPDDLGYCIIVECNIWRFAFNDDMRTDILIVDDDITPLYFFIKFDLFLDRYGCSRNFFFLYQVLNKELSYHFFRGKCHPLLPDDVPNLIGPIMVSDI